MRADAGGRAGYAALAAAAAGLVAWIAGFGSEPGRALDSWLLAFRFWLGFPLGALGLLMLGSLTGGRWAAQLRPVLVACARTMPVPVLALLPVLAGAGVIYPWAEPGHIVDGRLRGALWLNLPAFVARGLIYAALFLLLARLVAPRRAAAAAEGGRRYAGPALCVLVLAIAFSAVDWLMSLEPRFVSTIYGLILVAGDALSALCLALVVALAARAVWDRDDLNRLGNLLLAHVMTWAYLQFSQLLIVWTGNLPHEADWYLRRSRAGWGALAVALALLHFALPFAVLLARAAKRRRAALGAVAGGLLVMRAVAMYWLVAPAFGRAGVLPDWRDVAALLAVGGAWGWRFSATWRDAPAAAVAVAEEGA